MKTSVRPDWAARSLVPAIVARLSQAASRLGLVAAITLLVGLLPSAHAQSSTGSIRGRVDSAVTSSSLNNVRVSIVGSTLTTLTDEGGFYQLSGVPAGIAQVRFVFTGLEEQIVSVTVPAGGAAEQDVQLKPRASGPGGEGGEVVSLNAFVVDSSRETNASAIAVNEQRIAGNIKSVVSADEFGTIVDRNPGELLQYLPGIDVEYFANNITGVSVRGLGSNNTEINFDGMPTASMNAEGVGRGLEVQYASVADIARVEIRKLPLPEDSSNALGGAINMVRRSAFEYAKRRISYRALFQSDGERFTFDPMDGPKDREVTRWRPNWEVSWTEPLSRNLGFSFVVGQNDTVVNTHWSLPRWNMGTAANNELAEAAIAAGAPLPTIPSIYNPAIQNPLNHNAPLQQGKDYASLRVDWRPIPELTLGWSLSGTRGWKEVADDIRYEWNAAATGSGNVSRYNDPTTSLGRVGGGRIWHNSPLWRDIDNPTVSTVFTSKWQKDGWTATANVGWSESQYSYKDMENGFFNSTTVSGVTGLNNINETGVGVNTANPISLTLDFRDVDYYGPKTIQAWTTATGAASTNIADYSVPVDWWSNDVIRIGGARSRPGDSKEIVTSFKGYLKKDFRLRHPLSLQLGLDWSERYRNRRYDSLAWQFVGADGVPNTADDTARLIAAESLPARPDSEYGYPAIERISMSKLYDLYVANPSWFRFDEERSARLTLTQNAAYDLTETVTAPYLQFDTQRFNGRLRLTGGVRYEKSEATARGLLTDNSAAYMRYADGTPVFSGDRDANGALTVTNLGTSTAVNYQLSSPGVVAATRSGSPVFTREIQLAGNALRAAGRTTDTNTNLGRGTLAHTNAVYKAKGARGSGENDNFFPSLHATYNFSDNLVLQVGYAKTQAKLNFQEVIIPGSTITDELITSGIGEGALGRVTVNNPNLTPWTGDNYDIRLTYYTNSGGLIAVGAFTKQIKNFQVQLDTEPMTAEDVAQYAALLPDANLGPDQIGYTLRTQFNEGEAQLDGVELEARQNLGVILPEWGRGFQISGNLTYANRKGPRSNELGADRAWSGTANLMYNRGRFMGRIGYRMNGLQIENPTITSNGKTGQQVRDVQHLVNLNLEYKVNRWARLFVSGSNLFNGLRITEQRYDERPDYASLATSNSLGRTLTAGITGEF